MSDRLKQILEHAPVVGTVATTLAAAVAAVWGYLRSLRTTHVDAKRKEAEAAAAAAVARREAERLEQEAIAEGFEGLKGLLEYFKKENSALRDRIQQLEQRVQELLEARRACEEETASLRKEMALLKGAAA